MEMGRNDCGENTVKICFWHLRFHLRPSVLNLHQLAQATNGDYFNTPKESLGYKSKFDDLENIANLTYYGGSWQTVGIFNTENLRSRTAQILITTTFNSVVWIIATQDTPRLKRPKQETAL